LGEAEEAKPLPLRCLEAAHIAPNDGL
jgi:hypothetical protein